jgi:hypothetical protein
MTAARSHRQLQNRLRNIKKFDEAGSPTVMFHRVAVGVNGRMDWT